VAGRTISGRTLGALCWLSSSERPDGRLRSLADQLISKVDCRAHDHRVGGRHRVPGVVLLRVGSVAAAMNVRAGEGIKPNLLPTCACSAYRIGGRREFDVVTAVDAQYPLALRAIRQMPTILFIRGTHGADHVNVSLAGSRDASARGLGMAKDGARGLVGRDIAATSGSAAWIDPAADEATIVAAGRPCGVDRTASTGCTRQRIASCMTKFAVAARPWLFAVLCASSLAGHQGASQHGHSSGADSDLLCRR